MNYYMYFAGADSSNQNNQFVRIGTKRYVCQGVTISITGGLTRWPACRNIFEFDVAFVCIRCQSVS